MRVGAVLDDIIVSFYRRIQWIRLPIIIIPTDQSSQYYYGREISIRSISIRVYTNIIINLLRYNNNLTYNI